MGGTFSWTVSKSNTGDCSKCILTYIFQSRLYYDNLFDIEDKNNFHDTGLVVLTCTRPSM